MKMKKIKAEIKFNEKIFFVALALATILLPSAAFAAITIGSASFNKAVVYEQEEVVFSVAIVSDNDVGSATVEIKNTTLDLMNTSYKNYTLSRVGAATNGNWIYFFKLGPGIYQLKQVMATDNASVSAFRNYEQSTIAFKVLSSTTTTTTTSAAATTTTTTTTTTATETATTTTSTATSEEGNVFQRLVQKFFDDASKISFSNPLSIIYFLANPLLLLIIAGILSMGIIIYFVVSMGRKPKPENGEQQQPEDQSGQT